MAADGQGEGVEGETKESETPTERRPVERAQTRSEAKAERSARQKADLSELRAKTFGVLAGIVRWVGLIFALILVVHVILVVGEANPQNGITTFVKGWADFVALGFQDLFSPQDPKVRVLVNYGTAAIFWLVVSSIIATLIRRLGGEQAS